MIEIMVPFEQEGTKAIVRSWLRQLGDSVAENDPLVELETDKVTQEVSAPAAGVLVEILLDTDAEAVPGAILGRLASHHEAVSTASKPASMPIVEPFDAALIVPDEKGGNASIPLSPSVRRAVLQHGVDPALIEGTGRAGRVTRADVDRVVADREGKPQPALPSHPKASGSVSSRSVPHDTMRLAIARNMLGSVTSAPHVTAVFECDFSAIIAHRKRHKAAFEAQSAKLTYTAYFVAACVEAMRVAPSINSRWHDDHLELFEEIGIGIGTALGEKGLIVPVVRRAQSLSILGIAQVLTDFAERAHAGKMTGADMRGGTFTISNHGVSGSLLASPIIINQPQSAILGVGKLEKRVVVREVEGVDSIQIRSMAFVTLTIDHRVVDGHQTNAWLSRFVEVIENWSIEA